MRCGTLSVGAWLSLVERSVRDAEVGGSNPLAPTKLTFRQLEPDRHGGVPRVTAAALPGGEDRRGLRLHGCRTSVNRQLIAHLAQLDFLAEAKNIVFLGPPGTGKTHCGIGTGPEPGPVRLASTADEHDSKDSLALEAELGGHDPKESVATDAASGCPPFGSVCPLAVGAGLGRRGVGLIRRLSTRSPGCDPRRARAPRAAAAAGGRRGRLHPHRPEAASLFFALVSSRHERRSLIVSSNKPFSAWAEIFGDPVAVAAREHRLVDHTEAIVTTSRPCAITRRRWLRAGPEGVRQLIWKDLSRGSWWGMAGVRSWRRWITLICAGRQSRCRMTVSRSPRCLGLEARVGIA